MAISLIGPYSFIRMSKPPLIQQRMGMVETRSGIDGYTFWQEGYRGKPFTVDTFTPVGNYTLAGILTFEYQHLVWNGPQQFVYEGFNFSPWGVMVLNCDILEAKGVLLGISAYSGVNYAYVRARWELVMTDFITD